MITEWMIIEQEKSEWKNDTMIISERAITEREKGERALEITGNWMIIKREK